VIFDIKLIFSTINQIKSFAIFTFLPKIFLKKEEVKKTSLNLGFYLKKTLILEYYLYISAKFARWNPNLKKK
jgi:hypothetical protein